MAVIRMDKPVSGLVMFQQEPQLGEFHTMSYAPPMNGKEGTSPNVGNVVSRPLAPLEHATPSIEPVELSNVGSYVARKGEGMGRLGCGALGTAVGGDPVGLAGEGGGPEKLGGTKEDSGGIEATEVGIGVGDTLDRGP